MERLGRQALADPGHDTADFQPSPCARFFRFASIARYNLPVGRDIPLSYATAQTYPMRRWGVGQVWQLEHPDVSRNQFRLETA
jgi:hypothetical protein